MWYQAFVPYPYIIVPIMIITTTCHTPKNNTDVIITYSNHAEADMKYNHLILTTEVSTTDISTEKEGVSSDEGVVFVPNERTVMRNDDYLQAQPKPLSINDILTKESINDVLGAKDVKLETENPVKEDIIFVSGKNKEVEEKNSDEKKKAKHDRHRETGETEDSTTEKAIVPKLNCTNLDCNNTIQSVCGAKMERNKWKYRLFLNDCFFRKVNCHFKKKESRYKLVQLDYCMKIAVHVSDRPLPTRDRRRQTPEPIVQIDHSRRKNYRRSLTLNMNGQLCDHPCPSSCPENYDPECAISETGHKKVFVNHCKMDLNSCTFSIVWQRRPLADCVGGKKADMQQNRGFINWMQSVGIVDKKGRLNLN